MPYLLLFLVTHFALLVVLLFELTGWEDRGPPPRLVCSVAARNMKLSRLSLQPTNCLGGDQGEQVRRLYRIMQSSDK